MKKQTPNVERVFSLQDGKWNLGCDLETNCRNHRFAGGTGQISSTLDVEDFDSVSPQLFRVLYAVIWDMIGVTLLAEPQSG